MIEVNPKNKERRGQDDMELSQMREDLSHGRRNETLQLQALSEVS